MANKNENQSLMMMIYFVIQMNSIAQINVGAEKIV